MKRITFKPEFVDKILDGTKVCTIRAKKLEGIETGDIVSFVTRTGKTPAFLVKAENGFATARIKTVTVGWFEQGAKLRRHWRKEHGFDTAEEMDAFYQKSGVANSQKPVYEYRWQLVPKEDAK